MNRWFWILIVLLLVAVGAYWYFTTRQQTPTGLANPASVNCEQTLGGTLEIVNTSAGQVGYCHLPDGRVCEEWDLYRTGTCTPRAATSSPATTTATSSYGI